jgi:hypothetical protein
VVQLGLHPAELDSLLMFQTRKLGVEVMGDQLLADLGEGA